MTERPKTTSEAARFGAFGGVFTPCTLTILGVIMFLRFGEVVGNAGILGALVIVSIAKLITVLTALSLSAVATNTRVRGGGAYYLISRSLGIEFGGAIGVVFYLSQAVSVALYVLGFTEALMAAVPALAGNPRLTATMVNLGVLLCVYLGAGWTIKIQYGILALLMLSILSFAGGAFRAWDGALLAANWSGAYRPGQGFWTMLALFFPAVTGIMAGANMSGDLKEPARAIPLGTLAAIAFTGVIYLAMALLLGASSSREALLANSMIMAHRALVPALILAGVLAATLSSALGSMMGAPRILQALGRDKVLSLLVPFGRGSGTAGEPRRAMVVTFLIAQGGIALGELNAIAPVITMFFLITYGGINLATFFESVSGNPSYRPTFRGCHWSLSLVGALLCGGLMLLINPLWAVAAVLVMAALYRYLQRLELEASWGDVVSGTVFERARRNLLLLQEGRYHAKNWRPAILAMGGASEERMHLAVLARRLCGRHGLLMLGQVLVGDSDELLDRHANTQRIMRKLIADNDLEAFPSVVTAPTLPAGIASLAQCSGIGAVRPNMVLFGWNEDPERRSGFEENLRTVVRLGRSMAALRCLNPPPDPWSFAPGPLDVWWHGQSKNGHLMLLLAHLVRSRPEMRGRGIRLLRMVETEAGREETLAHLQSLSREVRIPCDCSVIVGQDFSPVLRRVSGRAALVFLGMADPREEPDGFVQHLENVVGDLPNMLFVHSAGDMSLHA